MRRIGRALSIALAIVIFMATLSVGCWAGSFRQNAGILAGKTATGTVLDITDPYLTSGNAVKITLLDAVLNGGYYIRCVGGTGTTDEYTVGKGGATTMGPATLTSTATGPGGGAVTYHKYARITTAALNTAAATGIELLPAVAGRQYRLVNARIMAYGGALTSTNATSLEIVSDPTGTPVVLYQVLKAQLARGTTAGVGDNVMKPCTTSTVLLADGASFVAQVAGKPIYLISTTGSPGSYDWATATGADVDVEYVVQ